MESDFIKFSKSIHNNNILNIALRLLGILFGLLSLRINILFLGTVLYGLWATIASVASWSNICDFGISNGLRNELTKAIAEDNKQRQANLIKTATIMISFLSIAIFIFLSILTEFFFLTNVVNDSLRSPMYITNAFFCINFILGISRTISYSYQNSWLASLAQTSTVIIQVMIVSMLIILKIAPDLTLFALLLGGASTLGNVLIIILLYKQFQKKQICLSNAIFSRSYRISIINIGIQFFILQLCCLILYSTDNLIINKLFDSSFVTKYSVINTVFNTGESLFSLLLISLWSAVTYAATKGEYKWIKNEIRLLQKFWALYCIGVFIVCVFFNNIVKMWLGDCAYYYEHRLLLIFGMYTIAMTFGAIYINVANGLGRIRLQIICSIIGALLNIPLSVFFAKTCSLGILGIKIATFICLFGSIIVVPIDIMLYLKKK